MAVMLYGGLFVNLDPAFVPELAAITDLGLYHVCGLCGLLTVEVGGLIYDECAFHNGTFAL